MKQKNKTVVIADIELAQFGLNPDMKNVVVSNAIRAKLNSMDGIVLPERVVGIKSGVRTRILEKLGLPKTATQKEINVAIEAVLNRL